MKVKTRVSISLSVVTAVIAASVAVLYNWGFGPQGDVYLAGVNLLAIALSFVVVFVNAIVAILLLIQKVWKQACLVFIVTLIAELIVMISSTTMPFLTV